tara:strand:+ start:33 stop:674 length:642 start_codon:yes stop_codon:yes gene_type:complete
MAIIKTNLATGITGTLPIANGGTAVTTAADLANTGNLVKLSSVIADNTTNIVFDSTVITDDYDVYLLTFRDIDLGTDSVSIRMLVSGDNGSTYINTSTYKRVTINADHNDSTDGNMTFKSGGQTQINLIGTGETGGSVDKESSAGTLTMFNLRKSDRGKIFQLHSTYETSGENGRLNFGSVYLDDSTVINNFKIYPSSGDFNEGTFTLYGFKE